MENKEIDHQGTDEVVCPYCGYEYSDSNEFEIRYNSVKIKCDECSKEFEAQAEYSVCYTSWKMKCKEGEHSFKFESAYISDEELDYKLHDWVKITKDKWKYREIFKCEKCDDKDYREVREEEFKERYPEKYKIYMERP